MLSQPDLVRTVVLRIKSKRRGPCICLALPPRNSGMQTNRLVVDDLRLALGRKGKETKLLQKRDHVLVHRICCLRLNFKDGSGRASSTMPHHQLQPDKIIVPLRPSPPSSISETLASRMPVFPWRYLRAPPLTLQSEHRKQLFVLIHLPVV